MKKKILIVPTFREPYKDQIELSIDIKLLIFLKNVSKSFNLKIAKNLSEKEFDILILAGGNDLKKYSLDKKDYLRNKFDNYYYRLAEKKNRIIIGICHGALFIASKSNSRIIKTKKHVGDHFIFNKKKKYKVNSYHTYKIVKLGKKFNTDFISQDSSTESFINKQKKIYGMMWHPERYKKFKKFDLKLFKKLLCN